MNPYLRGSNQYGYILIITRYESEGAKTPNCPPHAYGLRGVNNERGWTCPRTPWAMVTRPPRPTTAARSTAEGVRR